MRVVFYVRCHGEPNDIIENLIIEEIAEVVDRPQDNWGILTIGRSYYHDDSLCEGHPDAEDVCERLG